ncbi:MAG: hypothetical protein AABY64_08345 [Bdellovibrionota bacterium]
MKKNGSTHIGFDINLDGGGIPRPSKLSLWQDKEQFQKNKPQTPFKYFSDALLGASANYLCAWAQNKTQSTDAKTWHHAWQNLEPHYEMSARSSERVHSLNKQVSAIDSKILQNFESNFNEGLRRVFQSEKIDLKNFWLLIETIDSLEAQIKAPLLFNFSVHFSAELCERLQMLYSFLWNLRTLVAVDHNAHIEDPSHEALRMDSICDYLPKSDYVVNDALLYYHFKKLSRPYSAGKTSDVRIEKLLVTPLEKAFHQYSHNASYLIDHMPESFLSSMNPTDLEEALYLVQMDWLLGAPSGLLFKIREEIFGIQNGYEKIFWPEWDNGNLKKPMQLSVCCELTPEMINKSKAA